jgi:hypothetical protein
VDPPGRNHATGRSRPTGGSAPGGPLARVGAWHSGGERTPAGGSPRVVSAYCRVSRMGNRNVTTSS